MCPTPIRIADRPRASYYWLFSTGRRRSSCRLFGSGISNGAAKPPIHKSVAGESQPRESKIFMDRNHNGASAAPGISDQTHRDVDPLDVQGSERFIHK